jgi:hypothetical protein
MKGKSHDISIMLALQDLLKGREFGKEKERAALVRAVKNHRNGGDWSY